MASALLFLFLAIKVSLVNTDSIYNHEVKYYETITLLLDISETGRNLTTELEVKFRAFNRSFCFHLQEDKEFKGLEVESHGVPKSVVMKSIFFEGTGNATASDSATAGYLCDKVFCGIFSEEGVNYFMESAEFFFSNSNFSGKVVIYRSEDIENFVENPLKLTLDGSLLNKVSKQYLVQNLLFPAKYFSHFSSEKGIDKSSQPNADYACQIEMVADHTLYQSFNKDTDALSAFLYLHGKYADSIFRKTDFDGDGYKDNIRIVVKKIFLYKSANDANYPMSKASDLLDFLQKFSYRTQNYCLSVCMCYRCYPSLAIGRAYKPTLGIRDTPGGICQKVLKIRTNKLTFVPSSLNTAVVTACNSRGQTLPLITTLLAVTHEIGHSFGSDHDTIDNLFCSPGGSQGYYIMHPKTTKKLKDFSNQFSACSRQEIHRTMQALGGCLKAYAGTCGNGIREGDEECDCGPEKICKTLDPCCTPSDAKSPEKPCTFQSSKGALCSPKESPCCTKDCSVSTKNDTVCYHNDVECRISYCDGNSSSCPVPKRAPDGYPCQSTSKTCLQGTCNSSVCLDNGMKPCVCKEGHLVCFVCCEKDNQCLPAHKIGLKNTWTKIFVALAGSPCKESRNFRCDNAGNCIDVKSRRIENKKDEKVLWWVLALLVTIFVILVFLFLFLVKSHLSPSILVNS